MGRREGGGSEGEEEPGGEYSVYRTARNMGKCKLFVKYELGKRLF